jgi:probable HAF family extracellular repeat protein
MEPRPRGRHWSGDTTPREENALIPRLIRVLILLALPFLIVAAPAAALDYAVIDLGTLGGTQSFALDVNDAGQVTGNARFSPTSTELRAFLWDDGTMTNLATLPAPPTDTFSRGFAVNNRGQVTGESGFSRAFVWDAGVMTAIPTLGPDSSGFGADINDDGVVVGSSSNGLAVRAFRYRPGEAAAEDLGTLLGTPNSFARAWAINVDGLIVGVSRNAADTASQATLWTEDDPINLFADPLVGPPAVAADPIDPAGFSEALAISDARHIAGTGRSMLGRNRAFLWHQGAIRDLGVLDQAHSEAKDVNASGHVVGFAGPFAGFASFGGRAFRWRDGVLTDLNDRIPVGSGWILNSAEGVNRYGAIAGFGTFGGQTRAFLLTPDSPASLGRLATATGGAGFPRLAERTLLGLLEGARQHTVAAEAEMANGRGARAAGRLLAARVELAAYLVGLALLERTRGATPSTLEPLRHEAEDIREHLGLVLLSLKG